MSACVAFTGTRAFQPDTHAGLVLPKLDDLAQRAQEGEVTTFVTGAAFGVDTFVAEWLADNVACARHVLVVPAAYHNEALVEKWHSPALWAPGGDQTFIVEVMEPVPGPPPAQYKARDQRMVDLAHLGWTPDENGRGAVVAFAHYEERRQPRSGTWMTVRMARRAGVLLDVTVLEPEPSLLS